MNRAQLISFVLDDLDRQDLSNSQQPGLWLARAEERINSDLRAREMVRRMERPFFGDTVQLPDDFIKAVNFRMTPAPGVSTLSARTGSLQYVPIQQLEEMQANPNNSTHTGPAYYSFLGFDIVVFPGAGVGPTPSWQMQLSYYAKIPPLINDTDENWLSISKISLYHDLMMAFGYRYLKEEANAQAMEAQFVANVTVLNATVDTAVTDASRLVARTKSPLGVKRGRY